MILMAGNVVANVKSRENGMIDNEEELSAHPGYSVKFSDGTWLGGAHGWFRSPDAFYADRYKTQKEAEGYLEMLRNDKSESGFDMPAEIVEAWQPLCESLRVSVRTLKEANTIDPGDIMNITIQLEGIISDLNRKSK